LKTKTKKVKKTHNKFTINIIFIVIIVLLVISNIYFIFSYKEIDKEERVIEEVLFVETNDEYNATKKYYATLNYTKFKKKYKSKDITTIAVVDNSTNTYNKFIELVNKMSYYKNTKMYLLEINKLSRKNEIAFYNLDDRLRDLETNYIITVSNNKIISITTFENTELNKIIEGLGE